MAEDDRAARFIALRRRFLESAAADARELAALVASPPWPPDELRAQRILKLAHDLRGTGGAYGFDAVRDRGGEVEVAVRAGAGPEALRPPIERLALAVRVAMAEVDAA